MTERIAKRFRRYVRTITDPKERAEYLARLVDTDNGRRNHRERGQARVKLHKAFVARVP